MSLHNIVVFLLLISVVSTAQVQDKSYNIGLLVGPVLTNQKFPSGVGATYAGVKSTSEISSLNYSVQVYKVKALRKNWQLEINLSLTRTEQQQNLIMKAPLNLAELSRWKGRSIILH